VISRDLCCRRRCHHTHRLLLSITRNVRTCTEPTRLGCTTCTAMHTNGVRIIAKRITTSSRPKRIQRVQRLALSVFFGVGRGTTACVALVPLTAVGSTLVTVPTSSGFGWFVSWISSVVGLDHFPCPAARWWGHGATNT
jgi:hypothetical protein